MRVAKLPAGFEFPVNRKTLKAALATISADVQVELRGISFSEKPKKTSAYLRAKWFWVGIAKAAPHENTWRFSITLNGVRSERLIEHRAQIAGSLTADILNFIAGTLVLPHTHPEANRERSYHLGFELHENGVLSRSFVSSAA